MSRRLKEEHLTDHAVPVLDENVDRLTQTGPEENCPVKKGDVLLTSVPFVYILKNSLRGLHCDNCLRKKQGAQRCSGCTSAYYCNRECQRNSWETHKSECPHLKKLKPKYPPDTARLIARAIFRLKNGGHDVEEKINNFRSRRFKDLMSHVSDMKTDPVRQEHFTSLAVVLRTYIGEENAPDAETLLDIYGKILVNSFTITNKDLNGVGLGVYLAGSSVDHSCTPNAYASFVGTRLAVRALYDTTSFQWQKVRISYIDVLNTSEQRKEDLEKGYFFNCGCANCTDQDRDRVMSSITCGNPDCSYPVYLNESEDTETPVEECSHCGFADFDATIRESYRRVLEQTRTKLGETKDKNYFKGGKQLVEDQGTLLHPLNLWRVKLLDAVFESAIHFSTWEQALAYGCQNLQGLRFYYGSNHPMHGVSLLKLGKIELYLFRLQEALNHLEEAEPILRVSHGVGHPLYSDDLLPLLNQARQEIKMMRSNGFDVNRGASKAKAIAT